MKSHYERTSKRISKRDQVMASAIGALFLIGSFGKLDETVGIAFDGGVAIAESLGTVAGTGNQETASSLPTETTISPTPSEVNITESTVAPQLVDVVEVVANEECIGGTYDGWYFDSAADSIIDTVDYPVEKKEFLKFALRGICEAVKGGAPINPVIAFTQASLESNSGQDTLSPYNNFFGHKAGKNDSFVEVWTKEDYGDGNGLVDVQQKFTVYESPMDSFLDYADMIERLEWYQDAEACHNETGSYLASLQHEVDPTTCQIVRHQGEEGVLSYATDKNYETKVWNRAGHIKAAEYIYRP